MKIDLPVSLSILRSLLDSLPFNSHDLIANSREFGVRSSEIQLLIKTFECTAYLFSFFPFTLLEVEGLTLVFFFTLTNWRCIC